MVGDLLVVSDLHLGEGMGASTERTERLEQALVAFLDHHAAEDRPWRLVVNGDMLDLVGAVVFPADAGMLSGLHPDDHTYGLGARSAAAAVKTGHVIRRYEGVFRAIGRFLAAGKPLSIVIGNHDAELHWEPVQDTVRAALERFALDAGASPEAAADVTFHPWYFHEEGVAWIEHGHQYDPYCAFEEVLAPATDELEIDPNLGSLLPRYLVPRFALPVQEMWGLGFVEYLRFWTRQGTDRVFGIVSAYVDVFRRMAEHWRSRVPERLAARTALARQRLRALASRGRLLEHQLLALRALGPAPIQAELLRIVRALHVDRLLLVVFGPMLPLLVLAFLPWSFQMFFQALVALVLVGWAAAALVSREPVDPAVAMRLAAPRIRELARVPIVVMGHTHDAVIDRDGKGGLYINTGAWVQSDPDRAFTHLRIEHTPAGIRARLLQWRDGSIREYGASGTETCPFLLPLPRRA